jgi:hypothetical protein
MDNTGSVLAATGENNTATGATAWTSPTSITADDNVFATCNAAATSQYLVARNFGFTIPTGATIKGVTVTIGATEHSAGTESLSGILRGSGGAVGATRSATISGTGETVYTYGGIADNWSVTLTSTIVNDANFGVQFNFSTSHDVRVDYVKMAIEYSVGTTNFFQLFESK